MNNRPGGIFSLHDMMNRADVIETGDWYAANLMRFLHENLPKMDATEQAKMRTAYPREVEFMLAVANRQERFIIEARKQYDFAQEAQEALDEPRR